MPKQKKFPDALFVEWDDDDDEGNTSMSANTELDMLSGMDRCKVAVYRLERVGTIKETSKSFVADQPTPKPTRRKK